MKIALLSVHGCPLRMAGTKDVGGMNIYINEISKSLTKISNEIYIDIYSRRHDLFDPSIVNINNKVRVIHIPAGAPSLTKTDTYGLLSEFTYKISKFTKENHIKYDYIWSHYWLSGIVGIELSKLWQKPHVTTFHTIFSIKKFYNMNTELDHPMRSKSEKVISQKSDMVIAFTEHEKKWLVDNFRIENNKVRVIYPGVDKNIFHNSAKRYVNLKNNFDQLDLLFVGRNESIKGLDVLINSLKKVNNHKIKLLWRLNIVGGEYKDSELKAIKNKLGEEKFYESVNFIPSVEHTKLYEYYNRSDLLIVPSYYESFGLVALESLACSKPVIASNVGGLSVIVRSNFNGFLFDAGNHEDLSNIIISMYLENGKPDISKLESLSQNSFEYSKRFSWEKSANKILIVMQELK
ncbi:MAG: glycosyltransferase [Dehalococcoidia bacterium]